MSAAISNSPVPNAEESISYLETVLLDTPTAIFIDSRAMESMSNALGIKIEYGPFIRLLRQVCQLSSAHYYYAYPLDPELETGRKRIGFLNYLRREGWRVWWTEPATHDPESSTINAKMKLSVDALLVAATGGIKQAILVLKGPDYEPLLEALVGLGVRVVQVPWGDHIPDADATIDISRITPSITMAG